MGRYRVAMDIGGTFTDVVAYDEQAGTYAAGKASTTPHDLTEGVFAALAQVVGDVSRAAAERPGASGSARLTTTRDAVFGRERVQVSVAQRDELDHELPGPAIIEEPTATTVVPPSWTARVGELGTLRLSRAGGGA